MSITLPPLLAHAERHWVTPGRLESAATALAAMTRARATRARVARLLPVLAMVEQAMPGLRGLPDRALCEAAHAAGSALRARPDAHSTIAAVLATVCEASVRVLGQRPFPPQILAAHGCVRGLMVEMATGEGKTLAASLAAATVGLAGTPVHVLTVNRYLAERDAAFATPLYAFLGLSCGLVTESVPAEARRAAYQCNITVAVNKDVAFDYMRDRLALRRGAGNASRKTVAFCRQGAEGSPLLRGLYHAIVDEADSVLIDEARTPLILSGGGGGEARETAMFDHALELAGAMVTGEDFALLASERRAVLLPAGRAALAERFDIRSTSDEVLSAPWDVAEERDELIEQALTAQHLMVRDEHYLVRDGRAQIIDEYSGRIMPDRMWNDGLQELIERKEGLDLSPRHHVQARMTYQRFARRYRRLCGLSGTLHEVAEELWCVYGLRVVRVPTHRPDQKTIRPICGHADEASKWRAIAARAARLHARGAPVLIGTRTLGASAQAAAALSELGLPHAVLNAAQDASEAAVVAAAGRAGMITVATNMAGRGTDIHVDAAVAAGGGLRVIVSEPHESGRIDRQLIGRCGRQGQKGEAEQHVSLGDALLQRHATRAERLLARTLLEVTNGASVAWVARRAQRRVERLHRRMRTDLLKSDDWLEDAIAFAGKVG